MNNEEKEKILLEFDNLIHFIQQKYVIHNMDYEDLHQELLTHIAYKLDEYDNKRSKLSTYIYTVTENKLKNMYKNKRNKVQEIPIDYHGISELLDEVGDYSPSERIALEVAFDIIKSHDKKDMLMRIMDGETMTSIAEEYLCDKSTVSRIWKEFIERVKREL